MLKDNNTAQTDVERRAERAEKKKKQRTHGTKVLDEMVMVEVQGSRWVDAFVTTVGLETEQDWMERAVKVGRTRRER